MSGEREIRDTADALNKLNLRHTEILPLYARLSNSEQNRVFQSHSGRRIVLATNVAETSLTVPGIKYVIDPVRRVSAATAIAPKCSVCRLSQFRRLQLISVKAAAVVCPKDLYSSLFRRGFPLAPGVYRSGDSAYQLASVILQMTALGLGDIAAFPFVEAPDKRNIRDGVRLLEELGAITTDEQQSAYKLTPLGRQLSQLPVDPRLARMVLEAQNMAACVRR